MASAQSLVSDLQNELERVQSRPTQRGAELTAARQRLETLRGERDKLRPDSHSDTVLRARSTAIRAESAALKAQLEMLRLEGVSEPTRQKQAKLRSLESQKQLSVERALVGALDDLIDQNLWFLPSNTAISPPWFAGLGPAFTWLVDAQTWGGAALTLLRAWTGQARLRFSVSWSPG